MTWKIFTIFILLWLFFSLFHIPTALAENPSVSSFTASANSIKSGQSIDFIWTLQNAGGYSFLIPCTPGIKIKKTNGSVLVCDTKVSSATYTSHYLPLIFSNFSGGTKTVTARIVPKDSSGQDYDAAAQNVYFSIDTLAQPITAFSTSAITTSMEKSITISWSSQEIEGVNLSIECRGDIKVSSPSYTTNVFMPCATPIFNNDLSPNSSLILNFSNPSPNYLPLRLTLLPAIAPKSYDGTHTAYLDISVASDILPDPIVNTFSSSATEIDSGKDLKISWVTEKSVGANLKILCTNLLTATSSLNPTTILPCNDLAFTNALATSSTISLSFLNQEKFSQSVTLILLPSRKTDEYDATRSKNIIITVRPKSEQPVSTTNPPFPAIPLSVIPTSTPTSTTSVTLIPTQTPTMVKTKTLFTQFLRRGSRGLQVNALQGFLKKDPSLYPEGIISGFFGPATEKAVQRFQKKYNVAGPGITGYGLVGPKTRAKLNELQ